MATKRQIERTYETLSPGFLELLAVGSTDQPVQPGEPSNLRELSAIDVEPLEAIYTQHRRAINREAQRLGRDEPFVRGRIWFVRELRGLR